MASIATPTTLTQPRIVTLKELHDKLIPICGGDKWGIDTIGDLWKMGAPIPNVNPDQPEQRILLPGQFQKWFQDVATRTGNDLTARQAYNRTPGGKRASAMGVTRGD